MISSRSRSGASPPGVQHAPDLSHAVGMAERGRWDIDAGAQAFDVLCLAARPPGQIHAGRLNEPAAFGNADDFVGVEGAAGRPGQRTSASMPTAGKSCASARGWQTPSYSFRPRPLAISRPIWWRRMRPSSREESQARMPPLPFAWAAYMAVPARRSRSNRPFVSASATGTAMPAPTCRGRPLILTGGVSRVSACPANSPAVAAA